MVKTLATLGLVALSSACSDSGNQTVNPFADAPPSTEIGGNPTLTPSNDQSGNNGGITAPGSSILGQRLPATDQNNVALTSTADSSVIARALQTGNNPEVTPVSSRFECYDDVQTDLSAPAGSIDINDNTLTYSFLIGETVSTLAAVNIQPVDNEGSWQLVGADGVVAGFYVDFNEYGQSLVFGGDVGSTCFETGASLEAFLHQVELNQPDTGDFACYDAAGERTADLSLNSTGTYRVSTQSGGFIADTSPADDFSTLFFTSGALQDAEADYYEAPDNGIQYLDFYITEQFSSVTGAFTSSRTESLSCVRQSTPKPFKRYGSAQAPTATLSQQIIEGVYFIDQSVLTATDKSNDGTYLEFQRQGYLFQGQPSPGGTDCSRTLPNGLPYCLQYDFNGSSFSITDRVGQTENGQGTFNAQTGALSIPELTTELVTPVSASDLLGTWYNEEVDAGDFSLCLIGFCSSSISNRTLVFSADGRISVQDESDSSTSGNTGDVFTGSNATNSQELSGSYTLNGNHVMITDTSTGEIISVFTHITRAGRLAFGESQYDRR